MTGLVTDRKLIDHDGFYAELLGAHRGLTDKQSQALNAQLIMILANHIGDGAVLRQAIALARQNIGTNG